MSEGGFNRQKRSFGAFWPHEGQGSMSPPPPSSCSPRAPATSAWRALTGGDPRVMLRSSVKPRIPLGVDDFRKLRKEGFVYVDKSLFVREVVENSAQVVLLPRPRRFGKTLNLSMVRCFFDRRGGDAAELFAGLALTREGEAVWGHANRYPVIALTFKEARAATWETTFSMLRQAVEKVFAEHREAIDGSGLSPAEAGRFRRILEGTGDFADFATSLLLLSTALRGRYGEDVVLLIDEYDAPIHAAHAGGYLSQALDFFRIFLGSALKDNPALHKGVVTGILRVARENVFSGLNNLDVCTLLNPRFRDAFGFTESEVRGLFEGAGLGEKLDLARAWYNGYLFGGEVIYNPWSVLSFVHNGGQAAAYWLNTSSNDLVRDLLQRHAAAVQSEVYVLLGGGAIPRRLDENVVFSSLETDPGALWSLLLFSGYLKAAALPSGPLELPTYDLSIPNLEVREVYTSTFADWIRQALGRRGGSLDVLLSALLAGDAAGIEAQLGAFVVEMVSFHDLAGPTPERVYQALMIGLCSALLPDFEVRSNRETGKGRADLLLRPRRAGSPGVVLELKVARSKAGLTRALDEGMAQIRDMGYAAELLAAGVSPVRCIVTAFDGKDVRVRSADAGNLPSLVLAPARKARKGKRR